jgi:hypothetical protein
MKNFNFTTEQPDSGQFVILWRTFDGAIYSATFEWVGEELREVNTYEEGYFPKRVLPNEDIIIGYLT